MNARELIETGEMSPFAKALLLAALESLPQIMASRFPAPPKPESRPMETMERSEQINDLVAALASAQGLIHNAAKGQDNPFFRSKYADLAAVWDVIRQPLSSHGLSVVQVPSTTGQGVVSVETMLAHTSGQWIKSRLVVVPGYTDKEDNFHRLFDPQAVGSAITYARRYALQSIVGVAPEDDDGNRASGRGRETADDRRQAKREAAAEEHSGKIAGEIPPDPDTWRSVKNHIGKKNGPIYGKTLGELPESSLQWLHDQLASKGKLGYPDQRLFKALKLWKESRDIEARNAEREKQAADGDDIPGLERDGNEGTNRQILRENLEWNETSEETFLRVARREGWTGSEVEKLDDITDSEAAAAMENLDRVLRLCREEENNKAEEARK